MTRQASSARSNPRDDPADDALVRADGVGKRYRRSAGSRLSRLRSGTAAEAPIVAAVDDVSLTIRRGEIVGIAGPSGSGKSTLLSMLAGLTRPDDGSVTAVGTDLATCSSRELTRHRLRHVGFVFQDFRLFESFSARTNVALPLVELGVRTDRRRERATNLLESVGLGDRIDHRPAQLSGGERQRVAIARALVTEPALLIADEPTGELDAETGADVLAILREHATDRGVVLATHDESILESVDRVVRLRDGRRVDRDRADAIRTA
ncbi:ABC transporter ATP-binding protein [Halovivax gelatinilyticus]|uniref:ABC transporter ATP-binding protein n=1 Tax=Halovivax gelatinilyticus TaxID=2961597 RepID=UPI0020CA40D5|nr:ABC transporter ATP-binding protein [Halovivax gelatinilyticus]